MPSPFPGMDPYIEACDLFEDLHTKLIGELERTLSALVPDRYAVRTGERSYVVLSAGAESEARQAHPDVSIVEPTHPRKKTRRTGGTAVMAGPKSTHSPITLRALTSTEHRETFLEIRQLHPERKLVTCLEVLSPSNQRFGSPGWQLYNRKRQAFLEGTAHFVEIDLLWGGQRMPMLDEWPDSPYYFLVSRKEEAPLCKVWPAYFSKPLPTIFVPLAHPDPDISLTIQPMIGAIYTRSRYEQDIDYRLPLQPPLKDAQLAWLKKRLREPKARK